MIILLQLLKDNRDRITVFIGVPNVMFFCQSYTNMNHTHSVQHPWTYISGFSRDNRHIFNNNNKDCKALATKNYLRSLINPKLKSGKRQEYEKKVPTDFLVQVVSRFLPATTGCWLSHITISGGNSLRLPIRNRESLLAKIMNRTQDAWSSN